MNSKKNTLRVQKHISESTPYIISVGQKHIAFNLDYKHLLQILHILRKNCNAVNVSNLSENITKLYFVYRPIEQ